MMSSFSHSHSPARADWGDKEVSREQTRKLLRTLTEDELVEHWFYMETQLTLAKEALEFVVNQGCCCGGCGCGEHVSVKAREALEKIKK